MCMLHLIRCRGLLRPGAVLWSSNSVSPWLKAGEEKQTWNKRCWWLFMYRYQSVSSHRYMIDIWWYMYKIEFAWLMLLTIEFQRVILGWVFPRFVLNQHLREFHGWNMSIFGTFWYCDDCPTTPWSHPTDDHAEICCFSSIVVYK